MAKYRWMVVGLISLSITACGSQSTSDDVSIERTVAAAVSQALGTPQPTLAGEAIKPSPTLEPDAGIYPELVFFPRPTSTRLHFFSNGYDPGEIFAQYPFFAMSATIITYCYSEPILDYVTYANPLIGTIERYLGEISSSREDDGRVKIFAFPRDGSGISTVTVRLGERVDSVRGDRMSREKDGRCLTIHVDWHDFSPPDEMFVSITPDEHFETYEKIAASVTSLQWPSTGVEIAGLFNVLRDPIESTGLRVVLPDGSDSSVSMLFGDPNSPAQPFLLVALNASGGSFSETARVEESIRTFAAQSETHFLQNVDGISVAIVSTSRFSPNDSQKDIIVTWGPERGEWLFMLDAENTEKLNLAIEILARGTDLVQ